jgi:hypothetical protein
MLSPDTAQPGRSVWDHVGRKAFESGLDGLHGTRYVPEPHISSQLDWPTPRRNEILPFAIEKQLSDDVAFISAYDYGVGYVTAATVEADERDGLLVLLAANEGVGAVVTNAWARIFSTLEKCAKKGWCDCLTLDSLLMSTSTISRTVCRRRARCRPNLEQKQDSWATSVAPFPTPAA